jgi:hypothetical protein
MTTYTKVFTLCAALIAFTAEVHAQPAQVTDLQNTRFQWTIPLAEVSRIGYFDYWIDLKQFPEAGITRLEMTQIINGVEHTIWQAKIPPTLVDGFHEVRIRSCIPGAKVAEVDCSFWYAVNFEVKAGPAPIPTRPPTPTNGSFVIVTPERRTGEAQ